MHSKPYLPQLTGARAAAAYMVYVYHFQILDRHRFGDVLARLGNEGHVGVIFFYVLSGFVIFYNYGERIRRLDLAGIGVYLRNRFARIYPVYFLVLMVTYQALVPPPPVLMLVQLTLTQGLFPSLLATGIPQAWTLTVEETFYLSAPVLFRIATRWSLPAAVGFVLAIGFVLAMITGQPDFIFARTLCGTIVPFAAGMALARHALRHHHRLLAPGLGPRMTWAGMIGCLVVVGAMSRLAEPGSDSTGHPLGPVLLLGALPAAIATLYWGLLTERSLLRAALSSRILVLLGGASYSFYLIHMGVFQTFLAHAVTGHRGGQFLMLNALAVLLFLGFERPAQDWLRVKEERRPFRLPWASWVLVGMVLLLVLVDRAWLARAGIAPLGSLIQSHRAEYLVRQGRKGDGELQLRRAVESWPGNRRARLALAQLLLSTDRPALAEAELRGLLKDSPDQAELELWLARSLFVQKKWVAARESANHAFSIGADRAAALRLLGQIDLAEGKWAAAIGHFEPILVEGTSDAAMFNDVGVAWAQLGDRARARDSFEQALRADPSFTAARRNLEQLSRGESQAPAGGLPSRPR